MAGGDWGLLGSRTEWGKERDWTAQRKGWIWRREGGEEDVRVEGEGQIGPSTSSGVVRPTTPGVSSVMLCLFPFSPRASHLDRRGSIVFELGTVFGKVRCSTSSLFVPYTDVSLTMDASPAWKEGSIYGNGGGGGGGGGEVASEGNPVGRCRGGGGEPTVYMV